MFHVFYFFATITFAMILFYLQMPDENLKIILEETDDSFEMLEDDHIDPDFVPCSDSSDCTENFIPVGQVIFKGSDNLHIDENSSSNVVPPLSPVIPLIDDISLRRASSQLQHVPSPIDPSGPLINKITDYPFPRTSSPFELAPVQTPPEIQPTSTGDNITVCPLPGTSNPAEPLPTSKEKTTKLDKNLHIDENSGAQNGPLTNTHLLLPSKKSHAPGV